MNGYNPAIDLMIQAWKAHRETTFALDRAMVEKAGSLSAQDLKNIKAQVADNLEWSTAVGSRLMRIGAAPEDLGLGIFPVVPILFALTVLGGMYGAYRTIRALAPSLEEWARGSRIEAETRMLQEQATLEYLRTHPEAPLPGPAPTPGEQVAKGLSALTMLILVGGGLYFLAKWKS